MPPFNQQKLQPPQWETRGSLCASWHHHSVSVEALSPRVPSDLLPVRGEVFCVMPIDTHLSIKEVLHLRRNQGFFQFSHTGLCLHLFGEFRAHEHDGCLLKTPGGPQCFQAVRAISPFGIGRKRCPLLLRMSYVGSFRAETEERVSFFRNIFE